MTAPRSGGPEDVDRVRLFVAIKPDEQAMGSIGRIRDELEEACRLASWKVRIPRVENLHLTLKFLGSVRQSEVPMIEEALRPIGSMDRFEIAFSGLGAFPNEKKPRVLWLGVSEGGESVKTLAEQVDRYLVPFGHERESRVFSPHITLGRVKHATGQTARVMLSVSSTGPIVSSVNEVTLYRSDLHPTGARYVPLVQVELGH